MLKILYLSKGTPDYMSDLLYHGLISLGHEVEDINSLWYMFKSIDPKVKKNLYGKGFTVFGTLPDHKTSFFSEDKIQNSYYDLIIYGNCWRNLSFLDVVKKIYSPKKIIFIDGEDFIQIKHNLIDIGYYFKRELVKPVKNVYPIQFCIPAEKICMKSKVINKEFAEIKPRNLKYDINYIYDEEELYYKCYQESRFGFTCRKAGWDCMRHYEILANKCIPYFLDLENCPSTIMTVYPKKLNLQTNLIIEDKIGKIKIEEMYNRDFSNVQIDTFKQEEYEAILEEYAYVLNKYLTTKKIAEYVLNYV